MSKKINGLVLWQGPSVLDGAPIALIATLKTSNVKTGDMVQTWIIRTDVNPVEASKQSLDASVCGGCPHRHSLGGACYVNIGQAPNAVFKTYTKGGYPTVQQNPELLQLLQGRKIRAGAYGDPAAVPAHVWAPIVAMAAGVTGYTHQSAHRNFDPAILDFCMVSADTPKQALRAHAAGARTFRVRTPDAPMLAGEIECLADSEGLSCADCLLCHGKRTAAPNVVITVHGSRAARYVSKYQRINLVPVAA